MPLFLEKLAAGSAAQAGQLWTEKAAVPSPFRRKLRIPLENFLVAGHRPALSRIP